MKEQINIILRYRRITRLCIRRNAFWIFITLIIVFWTSPLYFEIQLHEEHFPLKVNSSNLSSVILDHPNFAYANELQLAPPHFKTILLWNSYYSDRTYSFGTGHEPFIKAKCPVSDCYVSNDLYAMPPSEYDAILFYLPMLVSVPFTYSRKPNQLYVLANDHPPYEQTNGANFTDLDYFFNLTMTYRRDSDIYWPRGSVDYSQAFRKRKPLNYAMGKSKLIAWYANDCKTDSHREHYVTALQNYVDVDVFGTCGNQSLQCKGPESCYDFIEKHYKFYLAFENSLCRDYVSEEFFNILGRRIVPIVYGAANYSSISPPGSFIDATQIGARRLAELVMKIDKDNTLYNQYFQWKSEGYRVKRTRQVTQQAFCQLCERLHQRQHQQIYQDFRAWWGNEYHCHRSKFIIPFTFSFVQVESVKPWADNKTNWATL